MKRFLLMTFLLAALLLVARATQADDDVPSVGPTTERPNFFDHAVRMEHRFSNFLRSPERRRIDAPRAVSDGVRFTLRDRDYTAVWIETSETDWDRVAMEYQPGTDRWTIDLDLPRGRTRYVFVVEDRDGDVRVRTDGANPTRRRDPDRDWVSEVTIDGDGKPVERRRDRHVSHDEWIGGADLELVDAVVVNYQRVDGFSLGFRPRVTTRGAWSPELDAAFLYGFSSDRWSSRLSLLQPLVPGGLVRFHASVYDRTDTIDRTGVGALENSLATLMFREDAYDWFRREGLSLGVEIDHRDRLLARVEFRSDELSSLDRRVIAGWGGRDDFLPNPAIDDGMLRSVFARVRFGTDLDHLWLEFETSDDDLAATDFEFTQLTAQYRGRLEFGRDGHFDFRARYGATLQGELPRQRRYLAGGIGTVRGYNYQSLREGEGGDGYGGEQMLLLNGEMVLGEDDLAFALFADAGQVWVDREDDVDFDDLRSSIGVGVLFFGEHDDDGGLRMDIIRPLEGDGDLIWQFRLRRPF